MKHFNITVNGTPYNVSVEETATTGTPVAAPAAPAAVSAPVAAPAAAPVAAQGAVAITAPMPGNILDVRVSAGTSVKTGDVLVILEAMKMENEILAPQDGVVASVNCAKGDVVNVGVTLVSLN